jgi:hypothetical protein
MAQTVRAFEVHLNGKKLCLAGIDKGVLAVTMHWMARPRRSSEVGGFSVGGLIDATKEHVGWTSRRLHIGDELRVKLVETDAVDKPRKLKNKGRT